MIKHMTKRQRLGSYKRRIRKEVKGLADSIVQSGGLYENITVNENHRLKDYLTGLGLNSGADYYDSCVIQEQTRLYLDEFVRYHMNNCNKHSDAPKLAEYFLDEFPPLQGIESSLRNMR